MIQAYVSQLRSLLGEGTIVTRGRAYELRVEPDAIDVERFIRMLRSDDADPRAALELWR